MVAANLSADSAQIGWFGPTYFGPG